VSGAMRYHEEGFRGLEQGKRANMQVGFVCKMPILAARVQDVGPGFRASHRGIAPTWLRGNAKGRSMLGSLDWRLRL
jgi:hypothetical protein